jgi:hypothetical protein
MTEKTPEEKRETPPKDVIDEAERLTHLAREAVARDEQDAYRQRRAALLSEHDYTARIREDGRDVLVVYPVEWLEDGTVRPERIEDIDRGIERPLEGPGPGDEWEVVAEHNHDLAEQVRARHGEDHGANARALAAFMNNHYAKPVEQASGDELREFVEEFYPRNVWPTDDQKRIVEGSIRLTFECADERLPDY